MVKYHKYRKPDLREYKKKYNNNNKIMTIHYVIFRVIPVFKEINTYSASIFKE